MGVQIKYTGDVTNHGTRPPGSPDASPQFCTTHWSVVLTAGQRELPQAAEALETLCRAYWYPLYAYVRRRGYEVGIIAKAQLRQRRHRKGSVPQIARNDSDHLHT